MDPRVLSLVHSFPSSILPLGGVEERTLEALGAVNEGHYEDVGQRGFDGHEDLFARGEREVRGWGLRRCGRHLASNLELLRASVRASWWCVRYGVGFALSAPLLSAPLRPSRPRGAIGSSRVVVPRRPSASRRTAPFSPFLPLSFTRSFLVSRSRMT